MRAILIKSALRAKCAPGQARLPKPKGKSNGSNFGLNRSEVGRKRSGMKSSGDGNITGSFMMPLQSDLSLFRTNIIKKADVDSRPIPEYSRPLWNEPKDD